VDLMIEVENLTKWYGGTLALDRASFTVQKGHIVGFLGPNGAGKSTTLRILTGYLPATAGKARVAGHDVLVESQAVRSAIGYMPENVPLYGEMRVEEYLRFRAGLKGVPAKERTAAVEKVLSRTSLGDVRRRLVGVLSKGYRQRVGLADALVADPPVLILDEPTIGLDPTQIQEVRHLVRSLSGSHTVLLSSHILPEVEKTCSHLVIISGGRIAAAGAVDDLKVGLAYRQRVVMEVRAGRTSDGPAEMGRAVGQVAGVAEAAREDLGDGWTRFTVTAASQAAEADPREALFALVSQRGWQLREMRRVAPSLEELWIRATSGDAAAGKSVA
jgi:ABC-2 type transport system ATP-binding protein